MSTDRTVRRGLSGLLAAVFVLALAGVVVVATPRAASADPSWCVDDCESAGVWYINDDKTGMCLAIGDSSTTPGAKAIQWTCEGISNQRWIKWQRQVNFGGVYVLQNQATGQCLAIPHGSATPGLGVIQWTCTDGLEQQWRESYQACRDGEACTTYTNVATGLVLAIPNGSLTRGVQAIQWNGDGNDDQTWRDTEDDIIT